MPSGEPYWPWLGPDTSVVPVDSVAHPNFSGHQQEVYQRPPEMLQLTRTENQIVKHSPQSQTEKHLKSVQAGCSSAQQGASAPVYLRCQHAVQAWHRTHPQATNDVAFWQQTVLQAEEELMAVRHQMECLNTALLQQNSITQANEAYIANSEQVCMEKLHKLSEQISLLQKAKEAVTSQHAQLQVEHRADQQKLADTQQQLAMMQEHACQQVQQVKLVFNYLRDTESTAADFPLSGVADLSQDLKNSIRKLFKILYDQWPWEVEVLLASGTHPWQATQFHGQQESRNKRRLQRDGFVHTVLLQLENNVWSTDTDTIFCFCLKQQITSNMHSARHSSDQTYPTTDDNPALLNIVSTLDVYTKSCRYWLSESKTSSAMSEVVEQRAFKLFRDLWPAANLEDLKTLDPELCNALCTVVGAAVTLRLYVESCHPCYHLSVAGSVKNGEMCSMPAVIVDSSLTLTVPDQILRIPAETC